MKKYIHIVLMLLVFSSCSDYLDKQPDDQLERSEERL